MATLSRRIARLPRPVTLKSPRADPIVDQLTREILEILASSGRKDVHAGADIGSRLLSVRERLAHGEFGHWIATEVPYTQKTAQRAINLHHLRSSSPALFDTIAPLGLGKAYLLMAQAPATIKSLVGKRHVVPSVGTSKTLAQMSFSELKEVIAARSGTPPDAATVIVRSYGRHVRNLIRTIDTLIANRPAIDEHAIDELHDDLLEAAARLAHAFDLDD